MSHISLDPYSPGKLTMCSQTVLNDSQKSIKKIYTEVQPSDIQPMLTYCEQFMLKYNFQSIQLTQHETPFATSINFILSCVEAIPFDQCTHGQEGSVDQEICESKCRHFISKFCAGLHAIAIDLCDNSPATAHKISQAYFKCNAKQYYDFALLLEECVRSNMREVEENPKKIVPTLLEEFHIAGFTIMKACIEEFEGSSPDRH